MKHFVPTLLLTGVLCFGLGYVVAQFSTESDTIVPQTQVQQANKESELTENDLNQLFNQALNSQSSTQTQPSPNQISKINVMIAEASHEKVNHYLKQAFPEADLSQIQDKKKFAQRAVEEFSQSKNDERNDLVGQVIVTEHEQASAIAHPLQNIHKTQYLFAHLDTFNQVANDQQVFIRWIKRDTGEVLFFSPQKVNADQSQNWVSFAPAQGWTKGTYDVRYYQMKDDLKPIAQASYEIQSIME